MNLYRIDTSIDFYIMTDNYIMTDKVWHWNNHDKQWDEAWHGLLKRKTNHCWVKSSSSPLEF